METLPNIYVGVSFLVSGSMPHARGDAREVLNACYWQTCANCSICVTVSVVGLP